MWVVLTAEDAVGISDYRKSVTQLRSMNYTSLQHQTINAKNDEHKFNV